MEAIPVVICADKNILHGVHATLFSLLENSKVPIKIILVHDGLDQFSLNKIATTCSLASNPNVNLHCLEISSQKFLAFRPLRGNVFAYAKLLIPDLVEEARVIYLDCDLIVRLELEALYEENLQGECIGASGVGVAGGSLEEEFFLSLGIPRETRIFNSGVMLLDLQKWRSRELTRACLEFGRRHADKLLAADQTLLNSFLQGRFRSLDDSYNVPLYAHTREFNYGRAIYHFIGAPKPWDPFARFLHGHYSLYADVANKTALPAPKVIESFTARSFQRMFRLSRWYLDCARTQLNFIIHHDRVSN